MGCRSPQFNRSVLAVTLALAACGTPVLAEQKTFAPGTAFTLRVGEQALSRDKRLVIGFEAVLSDSRCPKGEQCIVAGDATVRIWSQNGSGPRETRDLRAAVGVGQSAPVQGQELRLLRLDPVPVTGRVIDQGAYFVTLQWGRASASEADR